ncbi:hypothetical protein J437_LFUL016293 [Ladona fulva]|uniref:PiggyBac transposable element-derived protein domain-containing protein n=1 Tax=Ladona fulva TaxID=123851 RepID=A0A8K0PAK0_LADFU|nr:hypothetical protein J437_LFUL016293 [Ladona fulva]
MTLWWLSWEVTISYSTYRINQQSGGSRFGCLPNHMAERECIFRKKEIRNKGMLLGSQDYTIMYILTVFLSCVNVVRSLLQNKTYACATSQPSRKKWPMQLKLIKSLKLKRGKFKCFQSSGVTATVWCDKRDICELSTNFDPKESMSILRKTGNGNERLAISCPVSIVNYTKF